MPLKRFADDRRRHQRITHPPKNARPGARSLHRPQAFIAAARSGICAWEIADDPEGGSKQPNGRYLFTDAEPSIKARQPTLAYRIAVVETSYVDPESALPIEAPVIRWEGESELSADEAIAREPAIREGACPERA